MARKPMKPTRGGPKVDAEKVVRGIPRATKKAATNDLKRIEAMFPTASVGDTAEENMLEYGSHTIEERAISCLSDGLKPVHRRNVYGLFRMGQHFNSPHTKAASVVGFVMGKFHPHGDSSIYDAMVAMSNGAGRCAPFVDGQGNWGDYEDRAAAMRYCVAGSTRLTTAKGIVRMDSVPAMYGQPKEALTTEGFAFDVDLPVHTLNGETARAVRWINSGRHYVRRVETNNGSIVCTGNEPFLVATSEHSFAWVDADQLKPGMYVCMNRAQPFALADTASADIYTLLGLLISDGSITRNTIQFSSVDPAVSQRAHKLLNTTVTKKAFSTRREPNSYGVQDSFYVDVYDSAAVDKLAAYGLYAGNSYDRCVPESVWSASDQEVAAFIGAYFEGDGSISIAPKNSVQLGMHSVSKKLLEEMRLLLWTRFGVQMTRPHKEKKVGNAYRAFIMGKRSIAEFLRVTPMLSDKKQNSATAASYALAQISIVGGNSKTDVVPYVTAGDRVNSTWEAFVANFDTYSEDKQGKYAAFRSSNYFFARVEKVSASKKRRWVYDLTVEGTHAFTANGFVIHNTECRMTKLADFMLVSKPYMDEEVIPYIPNYDGKDKEPIYLPALLPLLFANGSQGTAVGVSCNMPPYTMESVIEATETLFRTKGNGKRAAAKLALTHRWGAEPQVTKEGLDEYHATGLGKVRWRVPHATKDTKQGALITVNALPLGTSGGYETWKGHLEAIDGVYRVDNLSSDGDIVIEIECRTDAAYEKAVKKLTISESYRAMTTLRERHPNDPEKAKVTFLATSPIDMLERWYHYRVALEQRLIDSLIRDNLAETRKLNLMVLAATNLDKLVVIIKAKSGDKVAMIERALKVNHEDAQTIWRLTVSQLDALNAAALKTKLASLASETRLLKNQRAEPGERIIESLRKVTANGALLSQFKNASEDDDTKKGKPSRKRRPVDDDDE